MSLHKPDYFDTAFAPSLIKDGLPVAAVEVLVESLRRMTPKARLDLARDLKANYNAAP